MTTDRSYRKAMGIDAAVEELRRHAGTQFDAAVVKAFCHAVGSVHDPDRTAHLPASGA